MINMSALKRKGLDVCRSKKLWLVLFVWFSLVYLECIVRYVTVDAFWNDGLFYLTLFALPIALLVTFFSSLGKEKLNRRVGTFLLVFFTLLIMGQIVYYRIFGAYFTLYSLAGTAAVAASFWQEALSGIWAAKLPLLLCAVPLLLWETIAKKWVQKKRISLNYSILLLFLAAAIQITAYVGIQTDKSGAMTKGYLYSEAFVPQLSVSNFGVLTTYTLDIKNLTVGMKPTAEGRKSEAEQNEDTVYNVLPIDYETLIAEETSAVMKEMHEYFSKVTPTAQNEVTGKYEGKNLIWICAEGFSSWALDREKTPTLYQMANQGYIFENFYNPIWGVSTSDGEYTTCTGLIPKSGVWSLSKSSANTMPFCLGNQLAPLGYAAHAYHDHSYRYYDRDLSHPNMGYDYKGYGNGLQVTYQWPESDVEMMELTVPEYINEDLFHTYYMSVSGHLEYNFGGNAMAQKHQDEVADLPYSEAGRAYIACQMEFDQAVANLMEQLEAAGKLDDTLIVISGDHYPYGLTNEEIDELNGSFVERDFELYHSTLILWDAAMTEEESVVIEKPCSPIDILPTISNLMGIPYDSRLLMGRDIFSDSKGLVIFSDHSWLTEEGRFSAKENKFYPADGNTVDDVYVTAMLQQVNTMFRQSAAILDHDYYSYVLPDGIAGLADTETRETAAEQAKREAEEAEAKAKAEEKAYYEKLRSLLPTAPEKGGITLPTAE